MLSGMLRERPYRRPFQKALWRALPKLVVCASALADVARTLALTDVVRASVLADVICASAPTDIDRALVLVDDACASALADVALVLALADVIGALAFADVYGISTILFYMLYGLL